MPTFFTTNRKWQPSRPGSNELERVPTVNLDNVESIEVHTDLPDSRGRLYSYVCFRMISDGCVYLRFANAADALACRVWAFSDDMPNIFVVSSEEPEHTPV